MMGGFEGKTGLFDLGACCQQIQQQPFCKIDLCSLMFVQVIALQASENPAMMAVVAQLQHATLTMPWEVRNAAAQAIAKVGKLSGI